MTDQEIAKNLKALLMDTPFQGKDYARVAGMVQWLESIEGGSMVVRPPIQEVPPDEVDTAQG